GKSLKNAIGPDDFCAEFGADTLRVYEMSMGPLDTSRPWATKDVVGAQRFLQRLWRLAIDENTGELTVTDAELNDEDLKQLNRTIAGIRDDYDNLRANTAVAKLIEYTNYLTKHYGKGVPRAAIEPALIMTAPVAPHIAEELWNKLGHDGTITFVDFPTFDEKWLKDDEIEIPIQVMGKVKSRVSVLADADEDTVLAAALADEKIVALIDGKNVVKKIYVPGRMVNLVVK